MGSKRTPVGWMGCESTHHPVTSNPQGGNPENLVAAPAAGEILLNHEWYNDEMRNAKYQVINIV